LTYIPLAALFCIIRIVQSIAIWLFSFIRPDLSIFPGYLAVFDHAHLAFVASVRLAVETERKFLTTTQRLSEYSDSDDDLSGTD